MTPRLMSARSIYYILDSAMRRAAPLRMLLDLCQMCQSRQAAAHISVVIRKNINYAHWRYKSSHRISQMVKIPCDIGPRKIIVSRTIAIDIITFHSLFPNRLIAKWL